MFFTQNISAYTSAIIAIAGEMKTPGGNGPVYLLTDEHFTADSKMRAAFNLPNKFDQKGSPYIETDLREQTRKTAFQVQKKRAPSFSDTVQKQANNYKKTKPTIQF